MPVAQYVITHASDIVRVDAIDRRSALPDLECSWSMRSDSSRLEIRRQQVVLLEVRNTRVVAGRHDLSHVVDEHT